MNQEDAKKVGVIVCFMALTFSVGYIVDCRLASGSNRSECWLTGQAMVNRGIDVMLGGVTGGVIGYWTPNPALRRQEEAEASLQADKKTEPEA